MKQQLSLGAIKQIFTSPLLALRVPRYFKQLREYRRLELERTGKNTAVRIYPCLTDAMQSQSGHSMYFYQDCWAARQVFEEKPERLVDLGSTVLLVGVLSQFTKCISVDIRPVKTQLPGLDTVQASILELPFMDNELSCITTMCVLEHIGLGRYGDPINPVGTVEAVAEISRVIAPGGVVVYSLPVGREVNEFNAHRRFTYQQAGGFFAGWKLVASCVLTPAPVPYTSEEDLLCVNDAVACFCYRKPLSQNGIE